VNSIQTKILSRKNMSETRILLMELKLMALIPYP